MSRPTTVRPGPWGSSSNQGILVAGDSAPPRVYGGNSWRLQGSGPFKQKSISSVQFSQSTPLFVTSRTAAQQASLSITCPRVSSNSCPLSQWCHPTISSSVIPFSSCPQSFPASGSFPMSQFFASGCQSIGVSASASVLPMNIQGWFPLGWTSWISLPSKGFLSLLQHHSSKKHHLLTNKTKHFFVLLY